MKCNEYRELLSLYIDRMLDEDQSVEVEEHLSACESCRKEYHEMKVMLDLLGQAEMLAVPDAFRFRLKKALKEEKRDMIVSGIIEKPSKRKSQWRILTSVAAVFAVGILSFGLYHDVLGILPNQLTGTEQSDMAQPEENTDIKKSELYSAESGADESTPGDQAEGSISMKQQTQSQEYAVNDAGLSNSSVSEDREPEMIIYGAAGGSAPDSGEEYGAAADRSMTGSDAASDGTDLNGLSPKIKPVPAQEDCSRSLTVTGVERNAAAVQYYDNLIAEKLKDFDYQVLESSYSKTGEWQFRIFIFRGKDGNTYNEEILIIGKDGEIRTIYTNEFLRL